MTLETCPGCGCREFDHKPSAFPQFRLSHCRQCGTAWTSPQPSPEELESYYGCDYYGPDSVKFVRPMERVVDWMNRIRARQLHRLLRAPGRVLEIGCGRGLLLRELARMGHRCCGIERSSLAAARASRIPGLQIFTQSLDECRFAKDSFDLVVQWHVLEHLENPNAVLKEIHRVLKSEGHLVLEVPNFSSWQAGIFGNRWFHLDIPRHLYHFSMQGLIRMLRQNGFTIVRVSTFSLEQGPFGALQSLLNLLIHPTNGLYAFLKREIQISTVRKLIHLSLCVAFSLPAAAFAGIEAAAARGAVLRISARKAH